MEDGDVNGDGECHRARIRELGLTNSRTGSFHKTFSPGGETSRQTTSMNSARCSPLLPRYVLRRERPGRWRASPRPPL